MPVFGVLFVGVSSPESIQSYQVWWRRKHDTLSNYHLGVYLNDALLRIMVGARHAVPLPHQVALDLPQHLGARASGALLVP